MCAPLASPRTLCCGTCLRQVPQHQALCAPPRDERAFPQQLPTSARPRTLRPPLPNTPKPPVQKKVGSHCVHINTYTRNRKMRPQTQLHIHRVFCDACRSAAAAAPGGGDMDMTPARLLCHSEAGGIKHTHTHAQSHFRAIRVFAIIESCVCMCVCVIFDLMDDAWC